jgi:hypothetical protein
VSEYFLAQTQKQKVHVIAFFEQNMLELFFVRAIRAKKNSQMRFEIFLIFRFNGNFFEKKLREMFELCLFKAIIFRN